MGLNNEAEGLSANGLSILKNRQMAKSSLGI
jgi:hypothetical protein